MSLGIYSFFSKILLWPTPKGATTTEKLVLGPPLSFLLASVPAPRGWHPWVIWLADHGDNLLSLDSLSDRRDWRLEGSVLPVWSVWSLHRSLSVSVPPLQYKSHILHTNTERSCSSCLQIFILKLIHRLYYYYCNVVCFSDVGLQPGNWFMGSVILLSDGGNLLPFNTPSYYL